MKLFGHRNTIRLQKYDYSDAGWYFVTVCTENRKCLFGDIIVGATRGSPLNEIVKNVWKSLPDHHPVELDEFIIMPNHIHGIITIVGAGFMPALYAKISTNDKRATTRVAPTIGNIIGAFKSLTTYKYIIGVKNNGWPTFDIRFWQRNYYEHIIRNEFELNRIHQYIRGNPNNWEKDINNFQQ